MSLNKEILQYTTNFLTSYKKSIQFLFKHKTHTALSMFLDFTLLISILFWSRYMLTKVQIFVQPIVEFLLENSDALNFGFSSTSNIFASLMQYSDINGLIRSTIILFFIYFLGLFILITLIQGINIYRTKMVINKDKQTLSFFKYLLNFTIISLIFYILLIFVNYIYLNLIMKNSLLTYLLDGSMINWTYIIMILILFYVLINILFQLDNLSLIGNLKKTKFKLSVFLLILILFLKLDLLGNGLIYFSNNMFFIILLTFVFLLIPSWFRVNICTEYV